MFEPPYLMDDRHLADIREVIAEVLETQRLQVNRAGNQQKAHARLLEERRELLPVACKAPWRTYS